MREKFLLCLHTIFTLVYLGGNCLYSEYTFNKGTLNGQSIKIIKNTKELLKQDYLFHLQIGITEMINYIRWRRTAVNYLVLNFSNHFPNFPKIIWKKKILLHFIYYQKKLIPEVWALHFGNPHRFCKDFFNPRGLRHPFAISFLYLTRHSCRCSLPFMFILILF